VDARILGSLANAIEETLIVLYMAIRNKNIVIEINSAPGGNENKKNRYKCTKIVAMSVSSFQHCTTDR